MKAVFVCGPYDGITLDHNDINLYTRFWPVGTRKFVLMPPKVDWDAVRRGDLDKEGPFEGDQSIYELVRTSGGMEGVYDTDGSILASATAELSEGRQPVPEIEFTGQYYKCYRGDLRGVALPDDRFAVVDEKDRKWVCVAVSREAGERGGFDEMLAHMGGEPSGEPLRLVILHCEHQDELRVKLSDQID